MPTEAVGATAWDKGVVVNAVPKDTNGLLSQRHRSRNLRPAGV
jgi:hypothetical protein